MSLLVGEMPGRAEGGQQTPASLKYNPAVFSNLQKRRKTARMMLHRLTIDLRISGPAFRAL